MAKRAAQSRPPSARPRTNLAPQLGRFVGRGAVLDALDAHVARGDRLVTVLGPPGIGKTRLAVRWAETRGEPYLRGGGVWFCDLTEVRDAPGVAAAVAKALGLRLAAELDVETISERVGDALAEAGPLLLVLDNFEQLVSHAARTLERWCAVASEAIFVVTSRERLGVSGEHVIELSPLELPREGDVDGARLLASEAAELFQERARAAGGWVDAHAASPSFAASLAELVFELDGLPLAIELAAAQTRLFAVDELLARIKQRRADVVSSAGGGGAGGGGAGAHRHATMAAAIDWSWNLLGEPEKSALAQAAVFASGFTLEAAERVIDLSAHRSATPVLDVLAGLVDKSLLKRAIDGATRTTRLSLYVSVREYAAARARERGEEPGALARHRRYYLEATRPWADAYARRGDLGALATLAAEKEQLLAIQRDLTARASLAPLAPEEAADLARVVLQLAPFVATEADYGEQIATFTAAIEAARGAGDDALRGRLLVRRSHASGLHGEAAKCLADAEEARQLGRALGDRVVEGEALVEMNVRFRQLGRYEEARAASREAEALLEGQDHPRIEGTNLACTGLLLSELGRAEESRSYNLRAKSILYAAGDRWSEGLTLANLAQLDQAAGDFEKAEHGYDLAIERFRESGDRRIEGCYLGFRAGLALERGDPEAARPFYALSVEIFDAVRSSHVGGLMHACLGALEAISGHARDAMSEFDRADNLLSTTNAPSFASALEVHRGQLDLLLAREAEARGDAERASKLALTARARAVNATQKDTSEDVRFAVRLLERELARHAARVDRAARASAGSTSEPRESVRPARPGLEVGPEARWFAIGDAPPIDLARRGALRLVLDSLVERRLEKPGAPTDWETLLGLGWPGERVLADAGATRVRVAISTLRRLGLAGMLVTRDSGYLLDPRAPVRRTLDL